jgi:hypothetical protein
MGQRSTVETLPDEIQQVVHELLKQGVGYREMADHLGQLGHAVSKSALHRYGQDYRDRLRHVQLLRDQARAYVSEAGAGLELDEAAHQLAMDLVVRVLMKMDPAELAAGDPVKLLGSLARLQSAGVQREAHKARDRKSAAEEAAGRIEKKAVATGVSPETIAYIRQEVLGLAS